jgi:uncharacterized membrane protein YdjX (TVP38/TMEM64 family)
MEKKRGIFKQFKVIRQINPAVAFGLLWVSLMPSLGSLAISPWLIAHVETLQQWDFSDPAQAVKALLTATLLMGLALMPTTLIAAISGFLFGWDSFTWLVLAYTLASLFGYGWGKLLTKNSLELLLSQYPKLQQRLIRNEGSGKLVFFVRLSPIIPFALSNLIFAMLKIGWLRLVVFGSIGMLPRTSLVFFSGTLAADLSSAIRQEGISWHTAMIVVLLLASIWGIWRFFGDRERDTPLD